MELKPDTGIEMYGVETDDDGECVLYRISHRKE